MISFYSRLGHCGRKVSIAHLSLTAVSCLARRVIVERWHPCNMSEIQAPSVGQYNTTSTTHRLQVADSSSIRHIHTPNVRPARSLPAQQHISHGQPYRGVQRSQNIARTRIGAEERTDDVRAALATILHPSTRVRWVSDERVGAHSLCSTLQREQTNAQR